MQSRPLRCNLVKGGNQRLEALIGPDLAEKQHHLRIAFELQLAPGALAVGKIWIGADIGPVAVDLQLVARNWEELLDLWHRLNAMDMDRIGQSHDLAG